MNQIAIVILEEPLLAQIIFVNLIGWAAVGIGCACVYCNPAVIERYFSPISDYDPEDTKNERTS